MITMKSYREREKFSLEVIAEYVVNASVDLLSQLVQLGLVDGLGRLLTFGNKFGDGMVETAL